MMLPQADGRTYACQFCGTRMQVAIDAQQIAAGMAFDHSNIEASMARLAWALAQGFPQQTQVQWEGQWLMHLDVSLDNDRFIVQREAQKLVARYQRVVRGIALKNAPLAYDRWFEQLTQALARTANSNARAAWVLGQIGGSR